MTSDRSHTTVEPMIFDASMREEILSAVRTGLTDADRQQWDVDPDQWPHTPPFRIFASLYDADDNLWWRAGPGHGQNAYDSARESIDALTELVAGETFRAQASETAAIAMARDLSLVNEEADALRLRCASLERDVEVLAAEISRAREATLAVGRVRALVEDLTLDNFTHLEATGDPLVGSLAKVAQVIGEALGG